MHSLSRLLPYYRRHRGSFWGGIALLLVARLFEALIPQLLKLGFDGLVRGAAPLAWLALGIVGCVVARYAAIWWGRAAIRRIGLAVAYHLRHRLYDHLQAQGPGFFARYRTGDLMARAINDIGLVRRMVGMGTRTVLVLLFSAAVGFGFMLRESPSLTLLLVPPLPAILVTAFWLSRRIHAQSIAVQEGFSNLSDHVQENLTGIRTIQALGQEDEEVRRFGAANGTYVDRYMELIRTNSYVMIFMPGFAALATITVLGLGGTRVVAGEISLGTFVAFLWYLTMVLWPVRQAGAMINLFQRGAAGLDRLFELLDTHPEIEDRPVPEAPGALSGGFELRNLSYTYPGATHPALDDVSLRVDPGETIAVLGRVGAGKTTLLRLLVRQLEAPPGTLLLDGHEIRELPLALVRSQVAMVPQAAFLFSASLADNIAYDDPARDEASVQAAIDAADLRETVERLPDAEDTRAGERGVQLSGGQRQRVTIARALVRDAPLLLLDDPFSAVDSETEERILRRLASLRRGATSVLVSHRVSSVRFADRIVVLEGGRLVECGTHDDLLGRGGTYAALHYEQARRAALLARLGTEDS